MAKEKPTSDDKCPPAASKLEPIPAGVALETKAALFPGKPPDNHPSCYVHFPMSVSFPNGKRWLLLISYTALCAGGYSAGMGKSETKNKVGARIKELRAREGLTQEKFALVAGVNRSYLADIEKGNRNFGLDTLERIVDGLGVSYSEFFEGI